MDPNVLQFFKKFTVKDDIHDESRNEIDDFQFLDRTIESNDSTASARRDLTLELLDSSNVPKYDRLAREIHIPFKRKLPEDGSSSGNPISFLEQNRNINKIIMSRQNESLLANCRVEFERLNNGRVFNNPWFIKRGSQEIETRPDVLARRQKQIDYGKNTIGYEHYIRKIPRNKRTNDHPWTPPKQYKYSRRGFDGLVKIWRRKLHHFDPPNWSKIYEHQGKSGPSKSLHYSV